MGRGWGHGWRARHSHRALRRARRPVPGSRGLWPARCARSGRAWGLARGAAGWALRVVASATSGCRAVAAPLERHREHRIVSLSHLPLLGHAESVAPPSEGLAYEVNTLAQTSASWLPGGPC
eukprot:scaffold94317_cov60-Phaeocystis_antarctica.AAC.1